MSAGLFATASRGGMSQEVMREIEAHRAKDRPTSFANLSKRYGVAEADIRALFPAPKDDGPAHISRPLADALKSIADSANPEMAKKLMALAAEVTK